MSNYTYPIIVGQTVVGVRQTIVGGPFTGVAPTYPLVPGPGSGVAYPAKYAGGMYTYGDPDDFTVLELDAGGLFDFGDNSTLALKCIRAFFGAAATYNLYVQKRGGTEITTILTVADADSTNREIAGIGLPILPSQTLKVTTTAAGTIDLYFARNQYP